MKILIVEDDYRIANPLAKDLRHQHHVVELAQDGLQGWNYAASGDFELILLDVMLSGLDGISLCRRLRQAKFPALILMLTAKDTTEDKVLGLDAGADDYLVKPFTLEELSARIRALARRSREPVPPCLTHGGLTLDPATQTVTFQTVPLPLTPKEYIINELQFLIGNRYLGCRIAAKNRDQLQNILDNRLDANEIKVLGDSFWAKKFKDAYFCHR